MVAYMTETGDFSMDWIEQPRLGDAIRAGRETKGLSQGALADEVMRLSGFAEDDKRRRNAVQVALSALEHGIHGRRSARSQYLPAIERALGSNLHNGARREVAPDATALQTPASEVNSAGVGPSEDALKSFSDALKALSALRMERDDVLEGLRGDELRCAIRLIQMCRNIADHWNP
jgi:hypothetical protein